MDDGAWRPRRWEGEGPQPGRAERAAAAAASSSSESRGRPGSSARIARRTPPPAAAAAASASPTTLGAMAAPGALRVVSHEGRRFLCFCDEGGGGGSFPRLHVTNASEFWSCEVTSEKLDGRLSQNESASPDDCISKLREFLGCQTPILKIRDSRATLEVQDGRQRVTFDLHKAPLSEARMRLQDLTFGLVAQVHQLEKRLEESATAAVPLPLRSPEKSPFRSQSLSASVRRHQQG